MLLIIIKYKLLQLLNSLLRGPARKKLDFLIILTLVPYLFVLTRSLVDLYTNVYTTTGWNDLYGLISANMAFVYLFITISVIAISSYRLFRSNDLRLIISLPISDITIFSLKILESFGDTARSMILPLPIYIAICYVLIKIGVWEYVPFLCVGLLLMMVEISCVSIVFAIIIGRWLYIRRWAFISKFISVMSLVAVLLIFFEYLQIPDDISAYRDFYGYAQPDMVRSLIDLTSCSWLLKALEVSPKHISLRLLYASGFVVRVGVSIAFAYIALSVGFKKVLVRTIENVIDEKSQKATKRRMTTKADGHKGVTRLLLYNELRLILREPYIIIGLSVPFVLFPIFVFGKRYDQQTQTFYITLLSTLVNTSYTLHCIGREGRIFAMLRSLPMKLSSLFEAKFITSFIINVTVLILFLPFSSLFCEIEIDQIVFNVVTGLIVSIVFSTFGVGLSALFPKFDHVIPLRAVQMPGLFMFYLLSSLIIGTVMIGQLLMPKLFLLVLIPWLAISLVVLRAGIQRLERMDI